MKKFNFLKKKEVSKDTIETQDFIDMISPSIIKFYTDYYISGNTYRTVWAIREYPTSTTELALLRYLGEKENVTLKIYSRIVTPLEERKIINNATNKNQMQSVSSTQVQDTIEAEADIHDLTVLIANMHRSREPLVHAAVFIEMIADDYETLRILESDVSTELIRSKMNIDKLLLRQREGYLAVSPSGYNIFKDEFERVLPASSVANLFLLITQVKLMKMASILEEINMNQTSSSILIKELMIKQTLILLF